MARISAFQAVEVSPRLRRALRDDFWRAALDVAAAEAATMWAMKYMPLRWNRQYAAGHLGHTKPGKDKVPFFERLVKSPHKNNRWIDGATKAQITARSTPKSVSMSVKMFVPAVVRKDLRKKFVALPMHEVSAVAATMSESLRLSIYGGGARDEAHLLSLKAQPAQIMTRHKARFVPMMTRLKASLVGQAEAGTMR